MADNSKKDALADCKETSNNTVLPIVKVVGGPFVHHMPWIVKIFFWFRDAKGALNGDGKSGTGFLVSGMWVLAARHSVERATHSFSPEDITVIAFDQASRDPGNPVFRRALRVDAIQFSPTIGDIVALRLHEPFSLDEYAPVSLEQTAADLIARREAVSAFGFGPPHSLRLGTAFGTVSSLRDSPDFAPSQLVLFPFDEPVGSGVTEGGDSGGPVILRYPEVTGSHLGMVVGIHVMGSQSNAAFVLLADHRDFIEPLLMPELRGSLSQSAYILRSSLHMVSNCSDLRYSAGKPGSRSVVLPSGSAAATPSCSVSDSYQFFFKRSSDGDSWDNARATGVAVSVQDQVYELPLDTDQPHSFSDLWDITALPVGPDGKDAKTLGAGENGKPLPGAQSNFFIRQTPVVSLPAIMGVGEQTDMPGMVSVTWQNSDCPISGVVRGYTLFYMPSDQLPGSWEGCKSTSVPASSYDTTAVVIPVDTSKNYALLALPVVGEEVVGTQENGVPYSGSYTAGQVLLMGKPVVRHQWPDDGKVLHVEVGSFGSGLMADVSFDDQNLYTWMRFIDNSGDQYTDDIDWSHTSGKNSPVLVFGTPDNMARPEDSGWYKLKVENAFGTTETKHVLVQVA